MTDAELDRLDKLAGEKIMDWPDSCRAADGSYPDGNGQQWQPSRNIAQAWECLEKFQKFGPSIRFSCDTYSWDCWFPYSDFPRPKDESATAPLAIVKAALAAKGVDIGNS